MLSKFLSTIKNNNLIKPGEKVIVAVSGGPDSVCLAHLLASLQRRQKFEVLIAHLNHALRGAESDQDADFVQKFAASLKITFVSKKLQKPPQNENAARQARYLFLEKVRRDHKAHRIAVAHNSDDQAETLLLHFLRGAGLRGLCGMQYHQNKVIRPLLNCSRAEILTYLQKKKLTYRADRTNLDTRILRNRVRHLLLPLLEHEFNPQIRQNLLNLGQIAQEANAYLENQAQNYIQDHSLKPPLQSWQKLPPILQKETIRQLVRTKQGNLTNLYAKHIAEVIKMLKTPQGNKKKNLPSGLQVRKKDGRIRIV